MKTRVGPYVTGDDFFGRDDELTRLGELLTDGAHVSLVAQRRIGKTSLLHEVALRLKTGLTCLYVDLQDCHDAGDAIAAIAFAARAHTSLWTKVQATFSNVLDRIESIGPDELKLQLRNGVVGDWRAKGDRLLGDLASADPPVVLMLDELPVLLVRVLRDEAGQPRPGGRDAADQLLSWLRKGAIAHTGRLRLVLTGSIGLGPIARQVGLSGTLNVYQPFLLEPWTPQTAINALAALEAQGRITLEEDARQEVVARLGSCIPYHVQLFYSQLEEDARRHRRQRVTRLDVERVYTSRMLSNHAHAELAHMEERLRLMVPSTLHALTLDLLTEAAVVGALSTEAALILARDHQPEGSTPDRALQDIFSVLEHDGYLERGPDGKRRFVSHLLRDWWRARFGEFYTPAYQRETT